MLTAVTQLDVLLNPAPISELRYRVIVLAFVLVVSLPSAILISPRVSVVVVLSVHVH